MYEIQKLSPSGRSWSSEGLGEATQWTSGDDAIRAVASLSALADKDPAWCGLYRVVADNGDEVHKRRIEGRMKVRYVGGDVEAMVEMPVSYNAPLVNLADCEGDCALRIIGWLEWESAVCAEYGADTADWPEYERACEHARITGVVPP